MQTLSDCPPMSSTRLLSAIYTTLLLLVSLFFVNCHATTSDHHCDSSCGNIHNTRYPFRFEGDPENCGNKSYELACENNRPVLHLNYGKYYVQAINYNNYSIRLVDVGIQKGNCSSRPLYSLPPYYENFYDRSLYLMFDYIDVARVVFMYCENPVKSPRYMYMESITVSSCINSQLVMSNSSNSSFSSSPRRHYSYFVLGRLALIDVADLCTIDEISVPTLWGPDKTKSEGNFSFLEFHNTLAYGFEISWVTILCEKCAQGYYCYTDAEHYTVTCYKYNDGGSNMCFACVMGTIAYDYIIPALKNTGWILGARTFCGMLCLFVFLIYKFRRRHLSMFDTIEGFLQSQNNLMPIRYSYWEIKQMTKGCKDKFVFLNSRFNDKFFFLNRGFFLNSGFKDKLGEGGYGSVYKGKLRSGGLVAVKLLGKSKANGQDFINEVATIGRIHHVNVVQLIGFCVERSKRALVYDFMPNGSLDKYIFSEDGNISLNCKQLYEISLGVARGIEYLHQGCNMQILHFDIKPHNILLDENFTPKVSDFGLAKLYPTDNSIVSLTAARGTMGYMAPELFYKNIGHVSYKADVYSFGMLLMEMGGRRRNLNLTVDHMSQIYFPLWIYDQFKEGKDIEMGEATEEERKMVKKMIIVALWCIQMKPGDRPSMKKVVEMLEGNIEQLQMPPKPFLTPQEMPAEDH